MNVGATAIDVDDAEREQGTGRATPRVPRALLRDPFVVLSLAVLVCVTIAALFPSVLAPADPVKQDLRARLQGLSGEHWLGTDEFGRDVLSRLIYGARTSMVAALIAVAVGLVLGVPTGLIAGYRGGVVDSALRLVFDGIMSVPGIIFIVAIVSITGPNLPVAMAVFGVLASPRFFRVQRGETITISGETFVEASRAIGCTSTRTLVRHVFLNTISAIVVQTSIMLGVAVIVEASISFLGLGAQPPTASWGAMLRDVALYMSRAPHMVFPPGLVIVFVVLSFSYLGDALRDLIGRGAAE